MSDAYVTVASYSIPFEAQLAAGLLEEEGIPSVLSGGITADTLGVSGLGGTVEVRVPEADFARARAVLAARARELQVEPGWEEECDPETGVWVCSLCGEPVAVAHTVCPFCQTSREGIQSATTALANAPRPSPAASTHPEAVKRHDQVTPGERPIPRHELSEEPAPLPAADTFLGDDLARRAFRCALFGCCTLIFLFTLYSLWLQFRLCLFPRELSPFALGRLRWTFLLNLLMLVLWTLFLWTGAIYWPALD